MHCSQRFCRNIYIIKVKTGNNTPHDKMTIKFGTGTTNTSQDIHVTKIWVIGNLVLTPLRKFFHLSGNSLGSYCLSINSTRAFQTFQPNLTLDTSERMMVFFSGPEMFEGRKYHILKQCFS